MTIAEGQGVVETARRHRRVYQSGLQRLSEGNFTFANELLRLGYLGKLHTLRAHIAPWTPRRYGMIGCPSSPAAQGGNGLGRLLGPCPWRPYNSEYTRGGWRNHYDFHTSCIGEWGAHTFAQVQVAAGLADTSPVQYKYVANDSGDGMVATFATA